MAAGGGIVVGLGREPRAEGAGPDAPSLTFDWTALEAAAECLKLGHGAWPTKFGLPIVVATSEKAESEIPDNRRALYETLLRSGFLHIESIMPGSRAAALLRQRQAVFGDALVILGGGTGVEHSANLYLQRRSRWCRLICRSVPAAMTAQAGHLALPKKRAASRLDFFASTPPSQTRKARPLRTLPRAPGPRFRRGCCRGSQAFSASLLGRPHFSCGS